MLAPNSIIDVIAPAYGVAPRILENIRQYITTLGFTPRIAPDMLGEDILCANSDAQRLRHLQQALYAEDNAAIWCVKGGYGVTRLMPEIMTWQKPTQHKWLLGFSDITALHVHLNTAWHWKTLHAPVLWQISEDKITVESRMELEQLLHGELKEIEIALTPMNDDAKKIDVLSTPITGGNMTVLQHSIGTPWQPKLAGHMLLLEDVDEQPYSIDRTLTHMQQSGVLHGCTGILLGDYNHTSSTYDEAKAQAVLARFANTQHIPVFRLPYVGHTAENIPVPIGTTARIQNNQLRIPV